MAKNKKNETADSGPIVTYGASTGSQPIQPKSEQSAINHTTHFWYMGREHELRTARFKKGSATGEIDTGAIAATPPNLSGMLRGIAWMGGEYRSGTICGGVDIGLAGI